MITVLKFLATMMNALDTLGTSEATEVRTITYLLEDDSKEVKEAQISDVEDALYGAKQPTN